MFATPTFVATSARWSRSTVGIPWTLLHSPSAFLTPPVRLDIQAPSVAPVLPYYGCNGNRKLFLFRMSHTLLSQPCMFMFRTCSVISVVALLLVLYSINSRATYLRGLLSLSQLNSLVCTFHGQSFDSPTTPRCVHWSTPRWLLVAPFLHELVYYWHYLAFDVNRFVWRTLFYVCQESLRIPANVIAASMNVCNPSGVYTHLPLKSSPNSRLGTFPIIYISHFHRFPYSLHNGQHTLLILYITMEPPAHCCKEVSLLSLKHNSSALRDFRHSFQHFPIMETDGGGLGGGGRRILPSSLVCCPCVPRKNNG